jgi:general secretion pathway protein G
MNFRRSIRGFTLIELLISVVIVGLLASVAMPVTELVMRRGKEKELREALRDIRSAIDAYKQAVDDGRIKTDVLKSGYPPNLQVLVEGAIDARSPTGDRRIYFLRRLTADPFAPGSADPASTWGKRSYASPPDSPADGEDVFDIYSQSSQTGLNGIRYKEW